MLVTDQKLSDAYDILTLLEARNIRISDGLWTMGQLVKEHSMSTIDSLWPRQGDSELQDVVTLMEKFQRIRFSSDFRAGVPDQTEITSTAGFVEDKAAHFHHRR